MSRAFRSLVGIASELLHPEEREAVLGDLAEANESVWQGLLEIVSLVLHRQAILWKSWQPWVAAFGLTVPNSFVLMGTSVSVSQAFLRLAGHKALDGGGLTPLHYFSYLLSLVFLLLACSWVSGFAAASISRRTIWVSAVSCALPCVFCWVRFRIESLPRVALLLFLLPAILGVRRGLETSQIKRRFGIMLAMGITILTLCVLSRGGWGVSSATLLWPAWYVVAAPRRI